MMTAPPVWLVAAVTVGLGVAGVVAAETRADLGTGGTSVAPVAPVPRPATIAPRNTGPAARAHSRFRRGRHGTTRVIRRTPDVMREDAARVKRGDLFGTWSNEYLQ